MHHDPSNTNAKNTDLKNTDSKNTNTSSTSTTPSDDKLANKPKDNKPMDTKKMEQNSERVFADGLSNPNPDFGSNQSITSPNTNPLSNDKPSTISAEPSALPTASPSPVLTTASTTVPTTVTATALPKALPKARLAKNGLIRSLFFVLGCFFVLLALIGIPLPWLPTTPFLLLATGCFARSSPKFHHWLINHKTFGSLIVNWQERRVIPKRAKYLAWTMMTASSVMLFWRFWHKPEWLWLAVVVSVICLCTMIWMARLPDS